MVGDDITLTDIEEEEGLGEGKGKGKEKEEEEEEEEDFQEEKMIIEEEEFQLGIEEEFGGIIEEEIIEKDGGWWGGGGGDGELFDDDYYDGLFEEESEAEWRKRRRKRKKGMGEETQALLIVLGVCWVILMITIVSLFLSSSPLENYEPDPEELESYPHGCVWVGHLNPSLTCYCSSVAAADLFKGEYAVSSALENEALYVIDYFSLVPPPRFGEKTYECVGVVNHNNKKISPISYPTVPQGIIDSHHISPNFFRIPEPHLIDLRRWGSTSTILYDIYKTNYVIPPKNISGCLLSSILSDTQSLSSPQTTKYDEMAVTELAELAEISDIATFYQQLKEAKLANSKKI